MAEPTKPKRAWLSKERRKCELTMETVLGCMAKGFPDPVVNDSWMEKDGDDIADMYSAFLCSLAKHTSRVNVQVIKKAIRNQYEVSVDYADFLARKLVSCFQKYSRWVERPNFEGKLLKEGARSFALTLATKVGASPSNSRTPSPSPSPPKSLKVEADSAKSLWGASSVCIKQDASSLPQLPPPRNEASAAAALWQSCKVEVKPEVGKSVQDSKEVLHIIIKNICTTYMKTANMARKSSWQMRRNIFVYMNTERHREICLHAHQVMPETVVADWSTKEVIRLIGGLEERTPMQKGPDGKIIGVFGEEVETIDYGNLVLDITAKVLKKPAAKKKNKKKKGAISGEETETATSDEKHETDESQEEEESKEEAAQCPLPSAVAPKESLLGVP